MELKNQFQFQLQKLKVSSPLAIHNSQLFKNFKTIPSCRFCHIDEGDILTSNSTIRFKKPLKK